jgi:hypothetical protein
MFESMIFELAINKLFFPFSELPEDDSSLASEFNSNDCLL